MARKPKAPKGANLVLENTRPCAIFLPAVMADQTERFQTQMLVPGQNNVDRAHFEALASNPAIRLYVKTGYLVVHEGLAEAEPLPTGLDGLSDGEALERLGKITDVNLLQDLRDSTASTGMRDLVQRRISEILDEGDDAPED